MAYALLGYKYVRLNDSVLYLTNESLFQLQKNRSAYMLQRQFIQDLFWSTSHACWNTHIPL